MKEIKCQHCEGSFKTETREEMLSILYKHYMESHADVIPEASKEEKKAWMVRFEEQWAIAEEISADTA